MAAPRFHIAREQPVLLAVYGTLMAGEHNGVPEEVLHQMRWIGDCAISGTLYDVGRGYPGVVLSPPATLASPVVKGHLFEIGGDEQAALRVLSAIDAYEGFDANAPERSEFIRCRVKLRTPARHVWIYVLNRDPTGLTPIPSGDWKEHRGQTEPASA